MGERLARSLRASGMTVPGVHELVDESGCEEIACPVLAWAGSGAMWLTGWPDGPPQWPAGDVIGALRGTAGLLAAVAGSVGAESEPVDIGTLLTGRAAARGRGRRGSTSVGGRSRILRATDGWLAVTLSRPGDVELLPALSSGALSVGDRRRSSGSRSGEPAMPDGADLPEDVWDALEDFTRLRPGRELMVTAQLLGLPAAQVTTAAQVTPAAWMTAAAADPLPWSISRPGEPVAAGRRRPRVVDFSAMWAGPLCAHLLGRCGAEVVKVEDIGRPDAARQGDPWLFAELHAGQEQVVLDFGSGTGRRALDELVSQADVVIEASRPRALGHLGLSPAQFFGARPGRTWVSITGHGRSGLRSNWVAFGDDAAAGGGLVSGADPRGPVFCGDAIADPISGLCGATAALASVVSGGGHLVDCSMTAASAFANAVGACGEDHRAEQRGQEWFVSHGSRCRRVERPRRPTGQNN